MLDEKPVSRADAEAPSAIDGHEIISRRRFLGRSAAAAASVSLLSACGGHASRLLSTTTVVAGPPSVPGTLTAAEMKTLEAVLAQLLPKDDLGPGAVEAGVPTYIDMALAGSYKPLLPAYQGLLTTFDTAAASMGAGSFAELSASKQIALLGDVEAGKPPSVAATAEASAAGDFQLLLEHMREGMFGDPMYGGNASLSGWELIGYPDIQLSPSATDQAIGTKVKPTRETAATLGGKPYNGTPV
jgi:gluconate 2-dehydrogenase gamma chain